MTTCDHPHCSTPATGTAVRRTTTSERINVCEVHARLWPQTYEKWRASIFGELGIPTASDHNDVNLGGRYE